MTFLLKTILSDPVLMTVVQVTLITGLALILGSAFLKAAAIRNGILLSALCCCFVAPLAIVVCNHTGWTLAIPVSEKQVEPVTEPPLAIDELPPEVLLDDEAYLAEAMDAPFDLERLKREMEPQALSTTVAAPTATPVTANTWYFSLRNVLLGGWATGTLVLLLGILLSLIRSQRLLRYVKPIDQARFGAAIRKSAANIGLAEFPRVGVTHRVHTPVAFGLFRSQAWILLPKSLLKTISHEQLVHVLTHEGAHLVRRDPLVHLIQRIHLALWWWHPLVSLLNHQLGRAREEICDNVVLKQTVPHHYGETLLELGKLVSKRNQLVATVSLFGSSWKLEHRIQGLLNPGRKQMTHMNKLTFTLILSAFVGISVLSSAARVEAQEDRKGERARAVDREAEIRREHEHIRRHRERLAEINDRDAAHQHEILVVHQKLEHLMVAHKHLEEAGLKELANIVAKQVQELHEHIDNGHTQAQRMADERRALEGELVRRAAGEQRQRAERRRQSDRERGVDQANAERRRAESRARSEQRRAEAAKARAERQRVEAQRRTEARRGGQRGVDSNEDFRKEIVSAIRELNAAVQELRNELNELRARDK